MTAKYVIVRTSDGRYVAKPGSEKSYVSALYKAQRFDTKEQATAAKCENEHVVSIDTWFGGPS